MALEEATLARLEDLQKQGESGRAEYYRTLAGAGDHYGNMALGVVLQSNMAGRVAYSYACEVGKRYCRPIDHSIWIDLSTELMRADFVARRVESNYEAGTPSLIYQVIRAYHASAFEQASGLPPFAWTAWIPLMLDGKAKDQKLWHRMLSEDFLQISVQVAWLACVRIVEFEKLGDLMRQSVVPVLQVAPPVVTGMRPGEDAIAACMARLAPYQLPGSDATNRERAAIFFLDVLACSANLDGVLWPRMIFGPSAGWSVGDFGRAAE